MAESPLFQFFRRVIRDVVREGIREILKSPKSPPPNDPPQKPSSDVGPKNHPWRVCPIGKHQRSIGQTKKMIIPIFLVLSINLPISEGRERPQPIVPILVHKMGDNFGDFEAPKTQMWMACHQFVKSKTAMVQFYILGENESHEFLYPRTMEPKDCEKELRLLRKTIGNAEKIRIVGRTPLSSTGPKKPFRGEPPARFVSVKKITTWYFSRVQADGRCLAYVSQHCDLPGEYWAGTTPF